MNKEFLSTLDERCGQRKHSSPFVLDIRLEEHTLSDRAVHDVIKVLNLAQRIEPNPLLLMMWYQHTRIMELGSLTAERLVDLGRTDEVVQFLQSIQNGARN
jgi:hypothetical protein